MPPSVAVRALGSILLPIVIGCGLAGCAATSRDSDARVAADPLPSWNDGATKAAIVDFVARTTDPRDPGFVPESERLAVFDQDGTLWAEQPVYVQLSFAVDRVRALRGSHPEWEREEPFASLVKGDLHGVAAQGEGALARIIAATHGGMTVDEFRGLVRAWIEEARHPETGRRFREMTYQPMLELLAHLRAHGYATFIVSGGGSEFVRAFAAEVYGISAEQVIGSEPKLVLDVSGPDPEVRTTGEIAFIDDGPGKPIGIMRRIGRAPRIAVGNSDGDLEMLRWTASRPGERLAVIVRHTDAAREWAYDRASKVGRLDRALDEGQSRGWTIVDMARDWATVYAPATKP